MIHDLKNEGENNDEVIFANQLMENEVGEIITSHSQFLCEGGYNACILFQHVLDKFSMVNGKPIEEYACMILQNPFEIGILGFMLL